MKYYIDTVIKGVSFEKVYDKLIEELKKEGFGIITEIDMQATFKKKLDVDFRKYVILGACNPSFAHQALLNEPKAGVFLPCNVIIEENESGEIEVFAVDPFASMMAIENDKLNDMANEIKVKLENVINAL